MVRLRNCCSIISTFNSWGHAVKTFSGWCERFAAVVIGATLLVSPLVIDSTLIAAPQEPSETSPVTELSEEELQQIKTAERFLTILERNPRRGTALDRVYGHHIEFGSLDTFLESLRERTRQNENSQNEKDGAVWMLLGLFEAQRGNDGEAVDALIKAEALRPQDAMASYYLAQSQLRIGQSEEAVASFERGIDRKPPRVDLLEIYQQLGRVHQRAQRTEEALNVWQRLEALYPDDPRVLEQIAVTLSEEGQPALALPRYKKLAELVKDDYRRVMYLVAASEMKIKTGQREEGVTSLEAVMGQLNPESWLYRDVRRRIDDVFLRSGDQDGLVKYYQSWLETHPEDVEGMSRLARFLATSARVPEASQWMEKALKLAPSRTDLRKTFIDQLVNDQRYPEAIVQYQQLNAVAPGNSDFLRDWGKLVLRNKEQPEQERREEAIRIWSQILEARPNDALTVSQVADLHRQNNLFKSAEDLYRKAVELSPADPQYREYLGEFLYVQKRPEEALVVWSGIADGDRRSAVNVTRLAEVYNSFGFPEKAVVEIADAVTRDPKDFALQLRAAEYHSRASKFDEALAYVASGEKLTSSDDERDAVIQQRIEVLQASQRLEDEADRLAEEIRGNTEATSSDWYLLARYMESSRRWPDATEAIEQAIERDPKSIVALTAAARIAETSGDYGQAAETNRKLAEIDRRSRGDHLMNVSRLEAQLGRADEALKAAQELILSAPGNTDHYEFYAQTCFRLGRSEEGLDTLRKAVRINPNEPHLIMAMGAALAEQLRTDEAIEVYWRAFEKSEEVEDKVGLTMKLAPLYQQVNQFDKLIERFERDRREEDKRREMTICLAQAWHTTGDFTAARQELESLLSEDTRDTNLLNQLAKLCQDGAELESAIGYQRQLVAIAPGHETEFPLAGMLMANGDIDAAREIYVKLTQREEDPVRQVKAIDSLLTQGNYESVISVVEPLLAQNRDDWELLYREAVAWASLEKTDEAKLRLERLLALTVPFDSLGRSAEAKLKQAQAKAKSDNLRGIATVAPQRQSALAMRSMAGQVQRATGLIANNAYYAPGSTPPVWTPEAFGVARMAALGWLLKFEEDAEREPAAAEANPEAKPTAEQSLASTIQTRASEEDASREAIYDWLYVAQLKNDYPAVFSIARQLAKAGGSEEQRFFLSSLNLRQVSESTQAQSSSRAAKPSKQPLSEEDLQLTEACYEALNRDSKSVDYEAMYGGNILFDTNGQAYVLMGGSYTLLPGVFRGEGGFLTVLIEELRLAGRTEEAGKLLDESLGKAESATELAGAMSTLLQEERLGELPAYLERWKAAALKQIAEAPVAAPKRRSSQQATKRISASVLPSALNTIQRWMAKLGVEEENEQVLSILDSTLEVAIAEAEHRRLVQATQTRRSTASSSSSPVTQISHYFGTETIRSNVTFPPLSTYIDLATVTLLKQVHEVLQRNDVASDLVDLLRKRVATAEQNDPDAEAGRSGSKNFYNELYLASALWWMDEQDEAVELMARAVGQQPDDLAMRFDLASMYEARGDYEDAITLVDSITPRDQKMLEQRELLALQLAERLGDIERARSAAERLFGLRLSSQVQLTLVDRMRRLGLNEMADAVLARVERTSTNQTSSLVSLMMLYQGQGKTDQANQLAHMLLRRTASPMSIMARGSRNPMRYRTSDSGYRTQALQLLQRSGAMKTLITQLKTQYERSPESVRILEQLIEFYGITGQKDEAGELLQKAVDLRPDSPMLHYQLAKHYEQTRKPNEACDEYLTLMKLQPEWVTADLYQIERVFTQAKRTLDLVNAVSSMNMKSISQPYYITNLTSNLLRDDQNIDVVITLLERAFDAFPQYRRSLVQNIRNNSKIWSNERFYNFAKRIVLPSELDVKSNPWIGLNEISSYSGNGQVSVFFHEMISGVKSTDRIKDLEKSIEELLLKQPEWMSGRAMLALIELETNRKSAATSRLQELINDEDVMKTIPAEACWIIGQELNRFEETEATAMTLFEKAIATPSQNAMSQIQYSPVAMLVDSYTKAGKNDAARDLLFKQLKNSSFDNYDASYAAYQQYENTNWVAGKLMKIEFPVDAIRLYRQLLDDPEKFASIQQFTGRDSEYLINNIKKGISDSVAMMDKGNAYELAKQLLEVPESTSPGTGSVDLMLGTPSAKELATEPIKSSLLELLGTLSKNPEITDGISARLSEMVEQHPEDLALAIASATWKLSTKDDDAAEAVRQLEVIASDHPLEEIPEGRRPNSRQRREATALIPLWLVARECLQDDELNDVGQQLAGIALQAARRQVGIKEQSAILFEWGKILVEEGNNTEAESRWAELLEVSTQRPQRTKKAGDPKAFMRPANSALQFAASVLQLHPLGMVAWQLPPLPARALAPTGNGGPPKSNQLELIPPLTLSQFRTAITVAKAAAENGMSGLSRKAVSESLKGGFPVADPVPVNPNARSQPFSPFPSSSQRNNADPIETEVVSSLKEIVLLWNGSDYPDEDTYQVLKSLVMPANRPTEILMYVTATNIAEAKVESLALQLVLAASRSNQLPQLLKAVNERSSDVAPSLPVTAMKALIATEQKNTDEILRLLNELAAHVSKGAGSADQHIALMVALRNAEAEATKAGAFPIIRHVLQQEVQSSGTNFSSQLNINGKLQNLVNSYLASTGDEKSIIEYFDSVLLGRQDYYSRYSGDSGLYQQARDIAAIANQAASLGLPLATLDFMGRTVDFEVGRYQRPPMATPLAIVVRHLQSLSPDDRYEAWRNWTLPTEGRETIRFVCEIYAHHRIPSGFLPNAGETEPAVSPTFLSNFSELVSAARDAGKLDELRAAADALVKQKLDNAELVLTLAMIAQDDIGPATKGVDKHWDLLKDRPKAGEQANRTIAPGMYLIYRACLESPSLVPLFENRLPELRNRLSGNGTSFLNLVNVDWANRVTAVAKRSEWPSDSPFKYWIVPSHVNADPAYQAWWAGFEDQVVHLSGYGRDELQFCYPLSGEFTVSMDCFDAATSSGDVGYGGIAVRSQPGSMTSIQSVSDHETLRRPSGMRRSGSVYNRLTVEVKDGQAKYFVNNYLTYQEAVSETSPWLTLGSTSTRVTSFRNLRIDGSPTIPRQVHLIGTDTMNGWDCSKFTESQPRRRLMAEKPANENDSVAYYQSQEPTKFDWSVREGVLHGEARSEEANDAQSWVHYHRPLRNGDSFAYEFHYVPGKSVAHPTIGRIAMLLDPSGVKTHWIATPDWDNSLHGVQLDNSIVESKFRRGEAPLPLKADDWNQVRVTLSDGVATVQLNDTVIYERPMEEELSTHFGIFRYKQQSSQVRNAILTGDWPTELSDVIREDLASIAEPLTSEQLNVVATIVDDAPFEPLAAEIVQTVRKMPSDQAFELLKNWVLPSPSHRHLRLYYGLDNPAADSSVNANEASEQDLPATGIRLAEILCPAIELVRAADAVGKLNELGETVDQLASKDATEGSAKQGTSHRALKALIAIESGDKSATTLALTEVWKSLFGRVTKDTSLADRSAYFLVAWQAAQHQSLWAPASDIVRELREVERDTKRQSGNESFGRHVNGLFADLELAMRSRSPNVAQPLGQTPLGQTLSQWSPVPYWKPELKSQGYRPSTWITAKGSMQHFPGETWSQMYFQSPLKGEFEVVAEHSTFGHREVSIAWGTHAAQPLYDLSKTRVTRMMHGARDVGSNLVLPAWDPIAETRFKVNGRKVTTWTNGVNIHEHLFDSPADPWLVIQASQPTNFCTVNNLRIVGTPEIPTEIDLIGIDGLSGWRADIYGESHAANGDTQAPWQRIGEELTGQLKTRTDNEHVESLLMYQRPMLEDGDIEFETWYEAGKYEVHPALGRDAWIIRPDGVYRHRLTNAQYETSGLDPGNEERVPDSATEITLTEKNWNYIQLSLKGDRLTISVNHTDVATIPISVAPNERHFGLFRYSNKTQCRVRQLLYRGEWPKTLPPVDEQDLAYPAEGPFAFSDIQPTLDELLNQPHEKLKSTGIAILGPTDQVTVGDDGLHLSLHDANGYPTWPGITRRKKIQGDFELTVDYRDVEFSPNKEGWGINSGISMAMDVPEKTIVSCLLSLDKSGKLAYRTQVARSALDGGNRTYDQIVIGDASTSGRLRMVREGGQVHCLVAPAGAEQFRLLASFAVGDAAVSSFSYQNRCSDAAGRSEATLERLTFREKAPPQGSQ